MKIGPETTDRNKDRGRVWLAALVVLGLVLVAAVLVGALAYRDDRVEAAPAAIDFGVQEVGRPGAARTVTLTNGDYKQVVDAIEIEGANAADFTVTGASTCADLQRSIASPSTLHEHDSCTIGVRFTPTGPGERAARLVISSLSGGDLATVLLAGAGVASS
jgi:hypothetical protein